MGISLTLGRNIIWILISYFVLQRGKMNEGELVKRNKKVAYTYNWEVIGTQDVLERGTEHRNMFYL